VALILADTDVLIDYLTGTQPVANQVLEFRQSDNLQTTVISCFELLIGAREGRHGDKIRGLIAAIPVLPLNVDSATRAAEVRRRLSKQGHTIAMADSLIAGIALENGLPLFTRNQRHFEFIEGLELVPVG
jgi:predicted nucleic acid-binding protein